MTAVDELLIRETDRLFGAVADHDTVQAAEAAGWSGPVWAAAAAAGLPWVSVPEDAGGTGGTLADATAIARLAGAHAVPVPVVETALAGRVLASAGLAVPAGPASLAPPETASVVAEPTAGGLRLSGRLGRVPWGAGVAVVVAVVEDGGRRWVVAVDPSLVAVEADANLAGEPRDTLVVDGVEFDARPVVPGDARSPLIDGALARAAQMAGALEAMARLTIDYTHARHQFGRPVARFQAVQQHLVHLAQQAALVGVAVDRAVRARDAGGGSVEVAAAKLLANRAASIATAASHQAHGAIGMTREYRLHHFSRRLWSWRHEFGGDRHWREVVGRAALDAGADGLFPLIADGTSTVPRPDPEE
ncbi:MAG: acyl-CoA dehydrogenase family protein [Acidimicrobiia bacterium]